MQRAKPRQESESFLMVFVRPHAAGGKASLACNKKFCEGVPAARNDVPQIWGSQTAP